MTTPPIHNTHDRGPTSPPLVSVIYQRPCASAHACTVTSGCALLIYASIPHLRCAPPSPRTTRSLPTTQFGHYLSTSPRVSRLLSPDQPALHPVKRVAAHLSIEPCFATTLDFRRPHNSTVVAPEATFEGLYVRISRFPSALRKHEDQEAGYIATRVHSGRQNSFRSCHTC